ncbi:MAG: hypothetical protein LBB90_10210 [Tannerella sp.]|nr:hypothetical protein [Tannerella sp.]
MNIGYSTPIGAINRERKPDFGRKGEKNMHVKKKSARVDASVSCVKETFSGVKEIIYAFGKKSTHVEEIPSCEEKKICICRKKSPHVIQTSTYVDGISTCEEKKSTNVDFGVRDRPFLYLEKRYLSAGSNYAQSDTVPIFTFSMKQQSSNTL